MSGNIAEWTEDCYHFNYHGAPTDGSAWTRGDCSWRVVRGGSWSGSPLNVRAAVRGALTTSSQYSGYGFRVARTD
jgi:formylglycine-generating enzyme required for sulfatase activity